MGKGRKERVTLLGRPACLALAGATCAKAGRRCWPRRAPDTGVIFLNAQRRAARRARPALPARSAAARGGTARRVRRRTRCATLLRATCSTAAPTCASSRSCSATPAWARRRSTPTFLRRGYAPRTGSAPALHADGARRRRQTRARRHDRAGRHARARRADRRRRVLPVARARLGTPGRHHQRIRRRDHSWTPTSPRSACPTRSSSWSPRARCPRR